MARVRSGGAKRWVERAAQSSEAYKVGVQNPRIPWDQATEASESRWASGIQNAITNKRFSKGVAKAGNSKWVNNAVNLGVQRYASGVSNAVAAYTTGIAPYLSAIEGITLPPRGVRGDPNNIQRVTAVNKALHDLKMQQ
jgi:hypothetical protein